MITQSEIREGLLYRLEGLSDPINGTADPAYSFTYQFAGTSQPGDLATTYTGWTALSAGERAAVRAALDEIESVANVQFTEVSGFADPDLNVGKVTIPGTTVGYGGYRYTFFSNNTLGTYDGFAVFDNTLDLSSNQTGLLLHEFGHALALKHPFETSTSSDGTNGVLPSAYDNEKNTVMSYTESPDHNGDPGTLGLFDILALQTRWGANDTTNAGNDTYTGPRKGVVDVIWDTGGTDALDASSATSAVILDLGQGTFSRFGTIDDVAVAYGTVIENAVGGAGSDLLAGNGVGNTLTGGGGDDTIDGLDGNDRLIGGVGNDTLNGGDGADTLNGGDGDDEIAGGATSADLRDVVYAGAGADNVNAGYGNDLVYGQGGNDTIEGGFGADELQGQDGNDVITGSALSDLVFGGAGDDFVNGGFGHDRINGGTGADKFYHLGIANHGSDWVQDYNAAEGDVLLFGNLSGSASATDFQVNVTHTENAVGDRAGDAAVQEAFVIYKPTNQIIWALVDGDGQSSINLQIGADVFDLLA